MDVPPSAPVPQTTWAWCRRCKAWVQVKYGGVTRAVPPSPTRMAPVREVVFRLHNSRPYFECLGSNMPVDPDRMVDTPHGTRPPTPLTEVLRDFDPLQGSEGSARA